MKQLTNSGQTVTDTYDTDAWGANGSSSGSTVNPFRFGGQFAYFTDADSGLLRLGVRYLDTANGRFTQRDPVGDVFLPYAYARQCPAARVDPEGTQAGAVRKPLPLGGPWPQPMRVGPPPLAHVLPPPEDGHSGGGDDDFQPYLDCQDAVDNQYFRFRGRFPPPSEGELWAAHHAIEVCYLICLGHTQADEAWVGRSCFICAMGLVAQGKKVEVNRETMDLIRECMRAIQAGYKLPPLAGEGPE